MRIEEDSLVDDVMRRDPATIGVFITHQMRCVGCPIGGFHTVADACREHAIKTEDFLARLRNANRVHVSA